MDSCFFGPLFSQYPSGIILLIPLILLRMISKIVILRLMVTALVVPTILGLVILVNS
jgi:hypothetical protein